MRIGISGLTIGGQRSGGAGDNIPQVIKDRIDAAMVDEPTAPAYFIDTQGGKLFTDAGGTVVAGDGDPVRSFRTAYGTDLLTTVPVDGIITYDATNKMFEMAGGAHQTVIPATGNDYSATATLHFSIDTVDTQWTLGATTFGGFILSAINGDGNEPTGVPTDPELFINGVSIGLSSALTKDAFRDAIAAAGKCIFTMRNVGMNLNGRWDDNGISFFWQSTFDIALDGKVGSFMISKGGTEVQDLAIASAIGEIHGLTI